MDAFALLVFCIVGLMILVSRLYRQNPRPEVVTDEADRTGDRLATLLEPDVMHAVTAEAVRRGCSEVKLVNDLLRSGFPDLSG